ncbi:phage portal protein [Kocuria salina]|uniref:phage portal protein n=1 Tax=Kocuria salina TaxID=1929416 RepID=UPI0015945E2D|nr:phage portal protein [Kocuria salina]
MLEGHSRFPNAGTIERGSDEWWMLRLAKKLGDRLPRIDTNQAWYEGKPPKPYPDKGGNFDRLQRIANLNPAEIIVNARLHRTMPLACMTAVDDSANGDDVVNRLFNVNDMPAKFAEILEWMYSLSVSYAMVDYRIPGDPTSGALITAEHPAQVIVEPNPADPTRPLAALKIMRDDVNDVDVVVLFRPGYTRVARHVGSTILPKPGTKRWQLRPVSWVIEDERTPTATDQVPIFEFPNRSGMAAFEKQIPTMERINHTILQRMILIALQAFRQRAVNGAPRHDDDGEEIDYDDIFEADPGAVWILPKAATLWESSQADFTPVLKAVADDLKYLAATSNTPLDMLAPDSANESAAGSDLKREGIVFDVESTIKHIDGRMRSLISYALQLQGETDRADLAGMRLIWANPRRSSLTERAESGRTAKAAGVPWKTRMEKFLELTPEEIAAAEVQRSEDAMLAVVAGASEVEDTDG